jgi:hypothetical protein
VFEIDMESLRTARVISWDLLDIQTALSLFSKADILQDDDVKTGYVCCINMANMLAV